MGISYNPNQIVLFPDLFDDQVLPSITTLPDFDHALENFVRMADFGTFIQLSMHGIDKSYSLNLNELKLPALYLIEKPLYNSPIYHLFPLQIRKYLNHFKYEVKAFFTPQNSIKTAIGYFLFRNYFRRWDLHRKKVLDRILNFLNVEIGKDLYKQYLEQIWNAGNDWIKANLSKGCPYVLADVTYINDRERVQRLTANNITLHQLDREDADFLIDCFILKTAHIPRTLAEYIQNISISYSFRTIHLEYLKDITIESIEDIECLFKKIEIL
jgi:hypothetical protein